MSLHSLLAPQLLTLRESEIVDLTGKNYPKNIKNTGLSSISYFYQYTNVPPLAYGSPAPKIAESVLRGWEYNRLPNKGRGKNRSRQFWVEEDGEYPFSEITSNFHLGTLQDMVAKYLLTNHKIIDEVASRVYSDLSTTPSTILTKGRQTWDPVNKRSVTCIEAYKIMDTIMRDNIKEKVGTTCLDFIMAINKLMSCDEITFKEKYLFEEKRVIYDKKFKCRRTISKNIVKDRIVTIKGNEEVYKKVMDWARSFCGYLKSKERSKLKRRAICSANIILRMMLYYIEEFHLELGKKVEGSTISIGGEEKKAKIIATMNVVENFPNGVCVQATEDATKWNECIAPEAFAVMHEGFFSDNNRIRLGLPLPNKEAKRLSEIMTMASYFLSIKRIFLGDGHICSSGEISSRFMWRKEDKVMMNQRTLEWFEKIEEDLDEEGYLSAPYGMFMGMLNAGSTTLGLLAAGYDINRNKEDIRVVRSSDDSMTKFSSINIRTLKESINNQYNNYKLIGINISPKKTRFFREGFGEYTSWYLDSDFTAQYGVETSSIRPQGNNPHDDFHSLAISTAVSQLQQNINSIGAQMKLTIGIDNVKRLWRIKKREDNPIREEILLLSDGGKSPWDSMNCHLQEIALKESIAETDNEKKYLLVVSDPNNPFNVNRGESTSYSIDSGTLVEREMEMPRNLFTYCKKSNATSRGLWKVAEAEYRKSCGKAASIFQALNPLTYIRNPTIERKMSRVCLEHFKISEKFLEEAGESLTEEEAEEIRQACTILSK